MLRRRRADPAEPVGRRGSYASAKFPEKLKSDRMPGDAQADRILAAAELTIDVWRTPQHQGQRPGPKVRCEFGRSLGNIARPASQLPDVADMDDDRMPRGTALDLVDSRYRVGIGRVGAQSVDGLRGKGNQAAASQYRHCIPNRNGLERVDFRRQGKSGTEPVSTRQLGVLYRFGLARAELREKFGEFRVSLGKHRDGKQSRVGGARLTDGKSRHRDSFGHLYDRQQ